MRDEDLVDWYKSAEEMRDISDWADNQSTQLQADMRDAATGRTPYEQNQQRQKHAVSIKTTILTCVGNFRSQF